MKTAIYIEDSILQVVLTPETEQEKNILALMEKKEIVQMYRGSFYACQGGWVQKEVHWSYFGRSYDTDRRDESLIFMLGLQKPSDPE